MRGQIIHFILLSNFLYSFFTCSHGVSLRNLDSKRVMRLKSQWLTDMPKSLLDKYPQSFVFIGPYLDTHEFDIRCCGSILHPRIVLTAARCEPLKENLGNYMVIGGTYNVNDLSKVSTNAIQLRRIAEWTNHPNFDELRKDNISMMIYHDLAIIKLRTGFIFGAKVNAASLPKTVFSEQASQGKYQCAVITLPNSDGIDSSLKLMKVTKNQDNSSEINTKRTRSRHKREGLINIDELTDSRINQFNSSRATIESKNNDDEVEEEEEEEFDKEEDIMARITYGNRNTKPVSVLRREPNEDKDQSFGLRRPEIGPIPGEEEFENKRGLNRRKNRGKSKPRVITEEFEDEDNDYIDYTSTKSTKPSKESKIRKYKYDLKNREKSREVVTNVLFTCKSNQGVPMFCHTKEGEIIQLAFRVFSTRDNCAKNQYLHFLRTDSELEWIAANIPETDESLSDYEEDDEEEYKPIETTDRSVGKTSELRQRSKTSTVKTSKSKASHFLLPGLRHFSMICLILYCMRI